MEANVILRTHVGRLSAPEFGPNALTAYLWINSDRGERIGDSFLAPWAVGFLGIVSLWWANAVLRLGLSILPPG